MAKNENKPYRGFHVRMPWAMRAAWPLLVKAYDWNLRNNQNVQYQDDRSPVFIPVEITECESDKDSPDGQGKCCYHIYLGGRQSFGVWVHSTRNTVNQWVEWVVDRIVLDDDEMTIKSWTSLEELAQLA
jgi:hypothetical protein